MNFIFTVSIFHSALHAAIDLIVSGLPHPQKISISSDRHVSLRCFISVVFSPLFSLRYFISVVYLRCLSPVFISGVLSPLFSLRCFLSVVLSSSTVSFYIFKTSNRQVKLSAQLCRFRTSNRRCLLNYASNWYSLLNFLKAFS